MENGKVDELITYSLDQQIVKFKVTSGNNQEIWGVNCDFKANQNKWTIDAVLQHMGFYHMMRNNSNSYKRGVTAFYPKLKSIWSCSHMNCCQHYMLHINVHILYIFILSS